MKVNDKLPLTLDDMERILEETMVLVRSMDRAMQANDAKRFERHLDDLRFLLDAYK